MNQSCFDNLSSGDIVIGRSSAQYVVMALGYRGEYLVVTLKEMASFSPAFPTEGPWFKRNAASVIKKQ